MTLSLVAAGTGTAVESASPARGRPTSSEAAGVFAQLLDVLSVDAGGGTVSGDDAPPGTPGATALDLVMAEAPDRDDAEPPLSAGDGFTPVDETRPSPELWSGIAATSITRTSEPTAEGRDLVEPAGEASGLEAARQIGQSQHQTGPPAETRRDPPAADPPALILPAPPSGNDARGTPPPTSGAGAAPAERTMPADDSPGDSTSFKVRVPAETLAAPGPSDGAAVASARVASPDVSVAGTQAFTASAPAADDPTVDAAADAALALDVPEADRSGAPLAGAASAVAVSRTPSPGMDVQTPVPTTIPVAPQADAGRVAEVLPLGRPDAPADLSGESAAAVAEQIVRSMRLQWRNGLGEARIQLRPEHLGPVDISIKVDGGSVTAIIRADSSQVQDWIVGHQQSLRQQLEAAGLRLDDLVVSPDADRRRRQDDRREQRHQPRRPLRNDADTTTFTVVA